MQSSLQHIIKEKCPQDNILIASLNWGLGHATRCYPIIKELLQQRKNITLASDGIALEWLKNEFHDQCQYLTLPGYNIHYNHKHFSLGILLQFPKISAAIKEEQKIIQDYTSTNKIDLIISDNRYGIFENNIHSVIITHQLQLVNSNPLQRIAFHKQVNLWLRNFQELWIPDYNNHILSGDLSHSKIDINSAIKTSFLGPLSRLKKVDVEKNIDALIILSGPEPKRTQLEQRLFDLLIDLVKGSHKKITVLRGADQKTTIDYPSNFSIHHLANKTETQQFFNAAEWVIARSGYSTLMDLDAIGNKAILIPTPGQKEQEYLATYHTNHPRWKFIQESSLDQLRKILYFSMES